MKEETQKRNIKLCPLCGGYAQLLHGKKYLVPTQSFNDDNEYRIPANIRCTVCGLSIGTSVDISNYRGIEEAFRDVAIKVTEKWNTRVSENLAKIEVLEKMLSEQGSMQFVIDKAYLTLEELRAPH